MAAWSWKCTLTTNTIELENKLQEEVIRFGKAWFCGLIFWFVALFLGSIILNFKLCRICLKFERLSSTSFLSHFCMPPEAALGQRHCATLNRPDVLGVAPKKKAPEKRGSGFWVLIFRIQLRKLCQLSPLKWTLLPSDFVGNLAVPFWLNQTHKVLHDFVAWSVTSTLSSWQVWGWTWWSTVYRRWLPLFPIAKTPAIVGAVKK